MSSKLDLVIETFLAENALTKGSQRVMGNKSMVSGLADAVRDDAQAHSQNFPPGSAKSFQKAKDEDVAKWFLEQLDSIEKEGYEGTIYSRDGAYNEWLARRYIAGSHNWEDLIGVMNMNLRDWTLLKNREMLQPGHTDVPKFNSVRDIGKYMSTHYNDKLQHIRDAGALAAIKKQSMTAKIVDNDDYKIFTVFNWAGARTVGNGTQWCTANSKNDTNYNNYSERAMLFQVFPKNPEFVDKVGKVISKRTSGPEKYQFDAGTPCFHDIADDPAEKESIKTKFPYLYSDVLKGLNSNKERLETLMGELSQNPLLAGTKEGKIRIYKIDDEIKKLERLKSMGYFTDKIRPAVKPEEPDQQQIANEEDEMEMDPSAETGGTIGSMGSGGPSGGGKYSPGTAPTMPESKINKGTIMENVDKDVAAMLANLKKYDTLKESVAPVLGMKSLGNTQRVDELSQETLKSYKGAARDDGRMGMIKGDQAKMDKRAAGMKAANTRIKEEDEEATLTELSKETVKSYKDKADPWNRTKTGSDGAERFEKGQAAADKRLKEEDDEEISEGKPDFFKNKDKPAKDQLKAPPKSVKVEEDDKEQVDEGADNDVIAWMKRFAKLGNMKGYGR